VGRTRVWLAGAVALAIVASLLSVAGCGGSAAPNGTGTAGSTATSGGSTQSGTIDVAGSDTMVKMAQTWAADYMKTAPDVTISVKGGGSGVGIAALLNGTATFADSSRDLKAEEVTQGQSKGVNPVKTAVAMDGIAIIVNKANTASEVSTETLGRIYRGEITEWSQVPGASGGKIVLLSRDNTSGTYEFMKGAVIGSDKEFAKSAKLLPATQAIVDGVGQSPDAIGYVGLGYESPSVKVLKVNGETPTVATVQSKSYVLSRDLYMISNGTPSGAAKAYLDWILGPAGQAVVQAEGFVPLPK
jgi:phosphate transport system substrate-binding protein